METVNGNELIERFGMAYFQGASVFGALSADTVAFLLQRGRVLHLHEGDVVYEPGDPGDRFYVVLQGSLAFYQCHLGKFAFIRDHLFGEEMGFVAMIALHERIGRAVAREDGYVVEITAGLFHALQKHDPAQFGVFLLNLSREMARTIREVSNLIVENAIDRSEC